MLCYHRRMELDPTHFGAGNAASGKAARIRELDRITLARDVTSDEGRRIAAGSEGTVVAVWSGGVSFDVEFAAPLDALANIGVDAIGRVRSQGD